MSARIPAPDGWLISTDAIRDRHQEFVVGDPCGWSETSVPHHAEPLYTLPNALRALASDSSIAIGDLRRKHRLASSSLFSMADELELPPMPDEPIGPAMVTDRDGDIWRRTNAGDWALVSYRIAPPKLWPELVRSYGPVKVWRAEVSS